METAVAVEIAGEDLIQQFFEDCHIQDLADRTITNYVYILRTFQDWLHGRGLGLMDVEKGVLVAYIKYLRDGRNCHHKTVKNCLSAISSFYEYLVFEERLHLNPVPGVRKRYLHRFKLQDRPGERKLISVKDMTLLVNSITEPRDKAIILLLAKTGIRRNELVGIDMDDIDWMNRSIRLKPRAKRSNCVVYFDEETHRVLAANWKRRQKMEHVTTKAFFVNSRFQRLNRSGVYNLVVYWATQVGLHDPHSPRMEDHFTPHCCRHWFTTHLRRAGMDREFIKELRGDARREAIDVYDHIEHDELKKEYLKRVPQLVD